MAAAKKNGASDGAKNKGGEEKTFRVRIFGVVGKVLPYAVLLLIFGGGVYFLGSNVKTIVEGDPQYFLTSQRIDVMAVVPPPPQAAQVDLREDAYRLLERDSSLSILDDDLLPRVESAFRAQPWVARVLKVEKIPGARVRVVVEYRRPVCMVQVEGGGVPVDAEAVLLPWVGLFTGPEAAKFPILACEGLKRPSLPGQRWNDSRVIGGAEVAAALLPLWETAKLEKIVPVAATAGAQGGGISGQTSSRRVGDYFFDVYSKGTGDRVGRRILWGHAPMDKNIPELTPAQKVEKLRALLAEKGGMDSPQMPAEINLQQP